MGHVPDVEAALDVALGDAGGDVAELERRAAVAAHVLHGVEVEPAHERERAVQALRVPRINLRCSFRGLQLLGGTGRGRSSACLPAFLKNTFFDPKIVYPKIRFSIKKMNFTVVKSTENFLSYFFARNSSAPDLLGVAFRLNISDLRSVAKCVLHGSRRELSNEA